MTSKHVSTQIVFTTVIICLNKMYSFILWLGLITLSSAYCDQVTQCSDSLTFSFIRATNMNDGPTIWTKRIMDRTRSRTRMHLFLPETDCQYNSGSLAFREEIHIHITQLLPCPPHPFLSLSHLHRLLSLINAFLIIACCDEGLRGPDCYQFTEVEGSRWPDFCYQLIEAKGLRRPKTLTRIIFSDRI